MNVANETEVTQPATPDAPDVDLTKDLERLHQMENIGQDVKKTRTKLTRQQTEEAKAESALKEERAKTRSIETTLEELLTDLSTLAAGGSLERLPFGEKSATTNAKIGDALGEKAWRDVLLADIGIAKAHVLNRLIENGITNFGELEDWRASRNTKPVIKGMGEAAMQVVEDAIVAYWTAHPRAAMPAADTSLAWKETSETQHFAETGSGIRRADDSKSTPQFVVTKSDGAWTVDQTSGCLMPDTAPGTFATVAEARAWCQRREDELLAASKAAEPKPLDWQPGESEFQWVGVNTAGIEEEYNDEETMVAAFVVEVGRGGLATIDMSSDTLLPTQFPLNFPTIDAAKAYCEARNRELCLKGREQMPEAFESTKKGSRQKTAKKAGKKRAMAGAR